MTFGSEGERYVAEQRPQERVELSIDGTRSSALDHSSRYEA